MQRFIRQQRILYLALLCIAVMLLYVMRLGYIQLFKHSKLTAEAVRQRAQAVILDYNRGNILDCNGISLLDDKKEKVLVVFPTLLEKSNPEAVELVSRYIPQAALSGSPFIALHDINEQEEETFSHPARGLVVAEAQMRYGDGALATHVAGHIGQGDGEGKVGLELVFNSELKGESPRMLAAIVDGKDNLVEGLGFRLWEDRDPHRPYDIVLTIDSKIQEKVEAIMDDTIARGAVIVMNPHNGDILAMASRPNYLQSQLSQYLSGGDNYSEYLSSQPFINRSILSYPPGSVFKIVTAAAALDSGIAGPGTRFFCPGYIEVGDKLFKCQDGQHGEITLAEAFAHSCNTVFIDLAIRLGKETICSYARAMGLGKETGIPLGSPGEGGEVKGNIPMPHEMPYLGDLALAAIGQGKVETTPLQVACLTAIVANGGYLVQPRLVKSIHSSRGLLVSMLSTAPKKRVLSSLTASKLRFMMLGTVEYGTGELAFNDKIVLGGKTGTAETGRFMNEAPLNYSWFTGIIPLENSRAVATVFVEESLRGNAAATFGRIADAIYPLFNNP
jgi:penicillin-binding protein 2